MSRSIIEAKGTRECFVCGSPLNLHTHHVFCGKGRRKMSEHYGLKVHLCMHCHEEVHLHPNTGSDRGLKELAQRTFEGRYSHELFVAEFGKSWI